MNKNKISNEQLLNAIIGQKNTGDDYVSPPDAGIKKKKAKTLYLYDEDYQNLKKLAYIYRQSVSEIIDTLIMEYLDEKSCDLTKFDELRKH